MLDRVIAGGTTKRDVILAPSVRAPGMWQTIQWISDPIGFLDACAKRHGHSFFIDLRGWARHLIVSRPEDVKAVMRAPGDTLSAGAAGAIMQPVLGPRSLFVLEGEVHVELRRRLLAEMRPDAYRQLVRATIEGALPALPMGQIEVGRLHMWLKALSMTVILAILLGREDRAGSAALMRSFERVFNTGSTLLMLMPRLQRMTVRGSPGSIFRRRLAELDAVLFELSRTTQGAGLLDRIDFASFGSQAEAARRDTAVSLVAAGYETVATALAWSICHLSTEPAAQAALRSTASHDPDGLIQSACSESMRLMPTIEIVSRTALQDCEINGVPVPRGTIVSPCIYLANRDPQTFPCPDQYRYDRFAGRKVDPSSYFPFGLGIRRCIGASLSTEVMKATLGALLERHEITAIGRPPRAVRHHVTIKPAPREKILVRPI